MVICNAYSWTKWRETFLTGRGNPRFSLPIPLVLPSLDISFSFLIYKFSQLVLVFPGLLAESVLGGYLTEDITMQIEAASRSSSAKLRKTLFFQDIHRNKTTI